MKNKNLTDADKEAIFIIENVLCGNPDTGYTRFSGEALETYGIEYVHYALFVGEYNYHLGIEYVREFLNNLIGATPKGAKFIKQVINYMEWKKKRIELGLSRRYDLSFYEGCIRDGTTKKVLYWATLDGTPSEGGEYEPL